MKGTRRVNLSSEPFRRDRPFVLAALAGVIFLIGLALIQAAYGWIERGTRLELHADIEKAQGQLMRVTAERAKLDAALREPDNAAAIEYSLFLNGLLLRKGISWTGIFGDLEKVMPHNVRLVAVRPQVNLDNQIVLDMTVASEKTEPVIDMLMRLETSPLFGATAVATWLPPTQAEPLYRYRVNVNYAPRL